MTRCAAIVSYYGSFFTDQLAWLRDRSHVRKITGQNGIDSLAMAENATRLAIASDKGMHL